MAKNGPVPERPELSPFIDLLENILPAVWAPKTTDDVKNAITKFYRSREQSNAIYKNGKVQSVRYLTRTSPLPELSQGDVISNIPIVFLNDCGTPYKTYLDAMILSNSCDIENDQTITFCPLFPYEEIKAGLDENTLKHNRYYQYFYISDFPLHEKVVSFENIYHIPKTFVHNRINKSDSERVSSLNELGFYLLLLKLSVHFIRPEDISLFNSR